MSDQPRTELPRNLSCGIVPVLDTADGWRLLMLRAWRNWDFPKGMREPGETPREAALRELREETGIDEVSFDWGEEFFDTGPYSRNKTARYFIARTAKKAVTLPVTEELGRAEHHEYRWVDAQSARRLATARVRSVVDWALSRLDQEATGRA